MNNGLPPELMLRAVLNALPVGLFWKDRDSRIQGCNQQFADDAGAASVDLIGKTNFELYPPAQADAYRADDLEVINSGQAKLAIEERLLLANGDTAWVETNKVPLRNTAGEIVGVLGTYRDITERRYAESERVRLAIEFAAVEQNALMAMHDPLTGLPNRRLLEGNLRERLLLLGESPEKRFAVVALDLDRVKTVNDLYGHALGDELLRKMAGRLSEEVGADGFIARMGGDEFFLLLTFGSDAELTCRLANLSAKCELPLILTDHQMVVGATLGVATAPADGVDPETLMRHADMALHCAKGRGGGRVVLFEPKMELNARERARLENDLRIAINNDQIVPYFQPIMDLRTGLVVCYEVLARWPHAERGLIQPGQFIKMATDTGLIGALTMNVLRRACGELTMRCPGTPRIAINIAPLQLRDATLPQNLLKVLSDCGISPHRLEIEITEEAIVSDIVLAKTILTSLKNCGVRIVLDDFGIGYSSLQNLSEMPFDALKIDQFFVMSMNDRKESLTIVKTILQLAKTLNLEVVAEGIETEEQALSLLMLGCEQGQGFYLGRPSPGFNSANRPSAESKENRATPTASYVRNVPFVAERTIAGDHTDRKL
ncbi:MAG: diguanylate cyclase [Rhodospirillaceae bacterium]|nr:diguanylate cyclase [Rhodospirillaceae bacterium]